MHKSRGALGTGSPFQSLQGSREGLKFLLPAVFSAWLTYCYPVSQNECLWYKPTLMPLWQQSWSHSVKPQDQHSAGSLKAFFDLLFWTWPHPRSNQPCSIHARATLHSTSHAQQLAKECSRQHLLAGNVPHYRAVKLQHSVCSRLLPNTCTHTCTHTEAGRCALDAGRNEEHGGVERDSAPQPPPPAAPALLHISAKQLLINTRRSEGTA